MDDYRPQTEREKRQDAEAKSEAAWWRERREGAPNLQAVIDAANARLTDDASLSRTARDRIEVMLVGASQRQRYREEITESDRDQALRYIAEQ